MKPLQWRFAPFYLFIVLLVLFFRGLELDPRHLPSTKIGQPLPEFTLNSLSDKPFVSGSLKGQVSLLNVWASWCLSCADEQNVLMKLASNGVVIDGLNYKDTADNANQWLAEWGNPYRQVGEDVDGKVGLNLGVYGAPETFLIDQKGIIRYRHVGPLTLAIWEKEFVSRIRALAEVV